MKIPLVGEDYASRSPAVSAQTCINLFPAMIDDPNEAAVAATAIAPATGKNKAVLFGVPGKHGFGAAALATAGAGNPLGVWSGGGRLFVVCLQASGAGPYIMIEVSQAGAAISVSLFGPGAPPSTPVQMYGNGNQLFIVAGGFAYIANPPAAITVVRVGDYVGYVTTAGTAVTWDPGNGINQDDQFDITWVAGTSILINLVAYFIASVTDATHLVLQSSAGIQAPVAYAVFAGFSLDAITGAYLADSFLVNRARGLTPDVGRQINFSAVLDGTSFNGLDFFSKETYADYVRSILADCNQLYVWGDETFEVWQANPNTTQDSNAFIQVFGAAGSYGNISPWGQVAIDGKVFFLGSNRKGNVSAYFLNGFTPVRISNHAQEASWKAAGLGPGAVSYAYSEDGHSFWVINFGAQTWVYEAETGAWHQRAKWAAGVFSPYQTNLHTFIPEWGTGGMHITAWTGGPGLFESSLNFYDDAGTDIGWQRALPYIYAGGKRQFFGRLDLEMETGSAPAGLPTITYDYSDDRGVTFINPRVAAVAAPVDPSATRVYWLRNGESRGRIPRFSGNGQTRVALIDLQCDLVVGTV